MNNRLISCLVTLPVLLLLAACGSSGKYVRQGDNIFYTYWTFSFGQRYDTVHGADAATFHSVKDWVGADKDHVFYRDRLVDGADPATLQVERRPLMRDQNDYYYQATAMHVASVSTFKVLQWFEDDFYARDSRYAYYDTVRFEADLTTFKVKGIFVAVDCNHVYRFGKVLPLADPATYDECWQGFYSRDKAHIWYMGDLVKDADYATFTVDGNSEAHDKYGRFSHAERITGEADDAGG